MNRNIFIKSMLRQRLRTAVLALLIAAAAFAFVMRAVEYSIVTDNLNALGGYYRAVGHLEQPGGFLVFDNVLQGADIVKGSPYVRYEDRRRDVEGILQGLLNADINVMSSDVEHHTRIADAFFFGELLSKTYRPVFVPPHVEQIEMVFRVDEVLLGYPEHAVAGQRELVLSYALTEEEIEAVMSDGARQDILSGEYMPSGTPADGMEIGQNYFVRGAFFDNVNLPFIAIGHPQQGRRDDALRMRPLNEDTTGNARSMPDAPIWHMPADSGNAGAFAVPEIEGLEAELEWLRRNQSAMILQTTKDMTALQVTHGEDALIQLAEGRMVDYGDHLGANPVAVVHEQFAKTRGLGIGDTLSFSVPQRQLVRNPTRLYNPSVDVTGVRSERPDHELTLEIVGIFTVPSAIAIFDDSGVPIWTAVTNFVYIPDSVLPEDIEFLRGTPTLPESLGFTWERVGWLEGGGYLPSMWYSFVLNDSRDESAFLLENRDALSALGYEIVFLDADSENFWTSADPILQSATINAAVFAAVLIAVFALAVFLHLKQRSRDYAILRALGVPKGKVIRQLLTSVDLLGLPSVIIGGAAGGRVALGMAESAMNPFGEIADSFGFTLATSLPISNLLILYGLSFAALLLMAAIVSILISRRPPLLLLQEK